MMATISSKEALAQKFEQIKENKKMQSTQSIGQELGQYGARALETVLGYPGNLKNAAQQLMPDDYKKLDTELAQQEKGAVEQIGGQEGLDMHDLIFNPPTSGEVREKGTKKVGEKLFGSKEFFEPTSLYQEKFGNFVQGFTNMFLPGTRGLRFFTRVAVPLSGSATESVGEYLGLHPDTISKAKLGAELMTAVAGQSRPQQVARESVNEAVNMVPQHLEIPANNLWNRTGQLYDRMTGGIRSLPSKSSTRAAIEDIVNEITPGGNINQRRLMTMRDEVNELIDNAGGFDVHPSVREATVRNLNELKSGIIRTIEENLPPEALPLYREGYRGLAVYHQSNAVSNYIANNYGKTAASMGTKVLFPSIAGASPFLPKTAGAAAIAAPVYQLGKVMYRTAYSPLLARHYQEVIQDAIRGTGATNAKDMAKNKVRLKKDLDALDKEMAKQEEKDKDIDAFKARFVKSNK